MTGEPATAVTADGPDRTVEHVQPSGLFPGARLGFTQVVIAQQARTVWVAGQTACDEKGRPVGGRSIASQADVALANLGAALTAVGARPADVTMLRVYVVGFDRERATKIAPRIARFFEGVEPPASTWVGVTALMHPDFLIEIEAVAALPD